MNQQPTFQGTMEEEISPGEDGELRLILVGKSGGGKSATGNTILGRPVFESLLQPKTTTLKCQRGQGRWRDRKISVVDTANIFDSENHSEIVQNEIRACVELSQPGPHALIFVTQVGRFTSEDVTAAKRVRDIFEAESARYTIVLFTCVEDLRGESLQDYTRNSNNHNLRELIRQCGNRFCGFNNKAAGGEWQAQVSELMAMVQKTVFENGGKHYVNWMYQLPKAAPDEEAKPGEVTEFRLILVGKTGGGKSATGNTILGRPVFESILQPKATTLKCQRGQGTWQNTKVSVVDTPDIFDSKNHSEIVQNEIKACIELSQPGPHALIFVTQVGRFTAEDVTATKGVRDMLGDESARHMIVLFTCVEDLRGESLKEYVRMSNNHNLRDLIQRCGNRFCGFNNKAAGADCQAQVSELMKMVQRVVSENRGRHYIIWPPKVPKAATRDHGTEAKEGGDAADVWLILVGKSGGGKSATGNTILGRREFMSTLGAKTTTQVLQMGQGTWEGRKIFVIDTPALFVSKETGPSLKEEMTKCHPMWKSGLHAFVLVTQVGRFTKEDKDAAKRVREIFGEKSVRHTIVLFTCKEDLGEDSLQEYVEKCDNKKLRKLIEKCGHRFCGFNNKAEGAEREKQVSELMEMVKKIGQPCSIPPGPEKRKNSLKMRRF